jgi:hypothetical protein
MIATPLLPQGGTGAAGALERRGGRIVRHHHGERGAPLGRTRTGVAAAGDGGRHHGAVERVGTATGSRSVATATPALRPRWRGAGDRAARLVRDGLPARETAHAALGTALDAARAHRLGSAALTAWDLFLDPQMVGEGYWTWAKRGVYRGIPLSNYVGWFVTGLGVMAAARGACCLPRPTGPPTVPRRRVRVHGRDGDDRLRPRTSATRWSPSSVVWACCPSPPRPSPSPLARPAPLAV